MIWMLRKRETYLAIVLVLAALACSARAQLYPVYPYYYQPAQPAIVYVPYYRPTWIGNALFGPVYVPFYAQPQVQQQQPQVNPKPQ